MRKLDARIKSHDKDIERMCNAHYQGFVDCIHELLQVRPQAQRLRRDIVSCNLDLIKSSDNVQRKADELIRYRKILCSAESAIDHLTACLPVLEMYAKLVVQMEERKYYPALKTLETLEQNLLPRVSKYRFAQTMCVKIPRMRDQIKDASMSDLKDFLENVRQLSTKIGEIAMKNTSKQQNLDEEYIEVICSPSSNNSPVRRNSKPNTTVINGQLNMKGNGKKRRAPPPPPSSSLNPFDCDSSLENPEAADSETGSSVATPSEDEMSATDLVDFSPVYRCLHIFTCLGSRDQFEHYYRQQRSQQSSLALQCPLNMHESIESYRLYFCGIMGFFVIEDHIMSTASGLVSKDHLNQLWKEAVSTMTISLRHHLSLCTDEGLMLKIKRTILVFTYAIRCHGFNVDELSKLLLEVRDQFNGILMKRWATTFKTIFDADNFHPLQVHSLSEWNDVLVEFPFPEAETLLADKESFPKKFPFSAFVPKVFAEVKKFVLCCLEFSRDINSSQREVEDMVRRSTNILLTKTLGTCLSSLIKKPGLGLLQLIQITINTNYLEDACVLLEDFISQSINSHTSSGTLSSPATPVHSDSSSPGGPLKGKSMFKDTRADAEAQIYKQLNKKIDEFLELATYDWLLAESNGTASPYVSDLIAFLKSTFEAFTNLPLKVAQTACHSACKHIASSLMNFLMEEEVKAISPGALEQFNLDLIQCELFASSEPVKGFEDGSLQLCFAELRQLMDLFTSWDWSTYFSDFGKQDSKYLRVNPQTAFNLLDKQKKADEKKNLFTSLKKNERDKKKLIDTVAKQLKQLIASNNSTFSSG